MRRPGSMPRPLKGGRIESTLALASAGLGGFPGRFGRRKEVLADGLRQFGVIDARSALGHRRFE
jgi:hypothetical protein